MWNYFGLTVADREGSGESPKLLGFVLWWSWIFTLCSEPKCWTDQPTSHRLTNSLINNGILLGGLKINSNGEELKKSHQKRLELKHLGGKLQKQTAFSYFVLDNTKNSNLTSKQSKKGPTNVYYVIKDVKKNGVNYILVFNFKWTLTMECNTSLHRNTFINLSGFQGVFLWSGPSVKHGTS